MTAIFYNATIKIWFNSQHTMRKFTKVTEITQEGNSAMITANGNKHFINFANVNLIEEVTQWSD